MKHSLEELLVMVIPTFVALQFVVNKKFIVKEVVLKHGTFLTHYNFTSPVPWKFLTRSDRSCTSWLIVYHHGLRWDGLIQQGEMSDQMVVFEDDVIMFVKGRENVELASER